MEFFDLIESRYSVRAYKSTPVEDEKLNHILEAARLAPTAVNRQPFQILVIHTKGREKDLMRIYGREWFVQPPIVLCVCGVPALAWSRMDGMNYYMVDVSIVMDHVILAAANQGLGSCWIGAFNPDAAREVLGLPDAVEPIAFTPIGYPDDEPKPKKRKELADLIRYENWQVKS
jgi:nitroreductase